MSNIIRLYGEKWNFEFYKIDDIYVITVIFSEYNKVSQMDVFRSFKINDNEMGKIKFCRDLRVVANYLREKYQDNKYREIIPHIFLPVRKTVMKYTDPNDIITELS